MLIHCIEGGVMLGFPVPFYGECNSGIGTDLGPRMCNPALIVVDLVFWTFVSWAVLFVSGELRSLFPA